MPHHRYIHHAKVASNFKPRCGIEMFDRHCVRFPCDLEFRRLMCSMWNREGSMEPRGRGLISPKDVSQTQVIVIRCEMCPEQTLTWCL